MFSRRFLPMHLLVETFSPGRDFLAYQQQCIMASHSCFIFFSSSSLGVAAEGGAEARCGPQPPAGGQWVGGHAMGLRCARRTLTRHLVAACQLHITTGYPARRGPWRRPRGFFCAGGAMADNPALCHLARGSPRGGPGGPAGRMMARSCWP